MTSINATRKLPKMLIADDDPSIVKLLADRCASVGFHVETATNGVNALIKAKRSAPDILLIDVNMPEVDGLSVCARLLDPGKSPLNIVVVTGRQDVETVERCDGFGAYYTRKGPDFWNSLAFALSDIFPDMAEQIKALQTPSNGSHVRKRPCVLLVDNDASLNTFLSSRLNKVSVDILHAVGALNGYRLACKERPSVIICEYSMFNGDANYLLAKLRTTPATEDIPFVVVSPEELDEIEQLSLRREICGRPGAARIFGGLYDPDDLFKALQEFCGFERHDANEDSRAASTFTLENKRRFDDILPN